jgi:hypothetical protein
MLQWLMTPEGEHGIAPPGGNPNIAEEGHVIPLATDSTWGHLPET